MVEFLSSVIFVVICMFIKRANCACPSSTVQIDAYNDVVTTFTSEGFPHGYLSLQDCSWLITASGAQRVALYIPYVYLERNFDWLYVFDGNSSSASLLWSRAGYATHRFFLASSDTIYIKFTSDYSVQRVGFKIQVMATDRNDSAASYSCGDTLTASTSYDQLSVLNQYDTHLSSACSFTITSGAGTNIQFSLQLNKNGGIEVYDGTSSSAPSIISYGSNDNQNTYQSTGNNIYVEKSENSEFALVYLEVATSATAPSTATTTTTAGLYYTCTSTELQASSTVEILSSPGYPDPYSSNLYCMTTIEAENSTMSVQANFIDVDLQECCDFLQIFDGYDLSYPLLWTSTVDVGGAVNGTGRALTVVFQSDGSGALRGFQLEYYQISRAIPSCASNNATSLEATTSVQSFTSPNYPSNYDNNAAIYWLITKTSESETIVIDIQDISLEFSSECVYDKLTIYDVKCHGGLTPASKECRANIGRVDVGPLFRASWDVTKYLTPMMWACTSSPVLAEVCGTNDAVVEDSNGLYILVEFVTDYSVTYTGFKIFYYMGKYEEDSSEETNPYLYIQYIVPPAIVLFVLIGAVIFVFVTRKPSKRRITPNYGTSNAGALVHPAKPAPPPKPPKRMTTSQLLTELQARYGSQEMDKKPKPSRKHRQTYGVQNELQFQRHPPPHGVPPPGGTFEDPAYPPNFFGISASETETIAPQPTVVSGSQLPPIKWKLNQTPTEMESKSIPGPAKYITPAEERQAGIDTSARGLFPSV